MPIWNIVLYCALGVSVFCIVLALLVGRSIKNRKNPNYKPVLNKIEKILSTVSVAVGVALVVVGILSPQLFAKPEQSFDADVINNISGEAHPPSSDKGVWVADSESPVVEVFPG